MKNVYVIEGWDGDAVVCTKLRTAMREFIRRLIMADDVELLNNTPEYLCFQGKFDDCDDVYCLTCEMLPVID